MCGDSASLQVGALVPVQAQRCGGAGRRQDVRDAPSLHGGDVSFLSGMARGSQKV